MVNKTLQNDNKNMTKANENYLYNRKVVPEKYFVAPKYNLAGCAVHKSFSAMLTSILCYLNLENVFMKKYNHLAEFTFHFKKCIEKKDNNLESFGELINIHGKKDKNNFLKTWKVIMVVRNPIERFISGFVHFCYYHNYSSTGKMCLNCGNNFICYVNKLFQILKSNYVTMIRTPQPVRTHFFPQTMQCNYRINKDKFTILKYDPKNLDDFYKSLEKIFLKQNVPQEKVDFIDKEIRGYLIPHSTTGRKRRERFAQKIYKNKNILKKLVQIYYADLIEFEFQIPK